MDDIFTAALHILKTSEDVALIRIIDAEGSTPRPAGARMVISRKGRIIGTIGGGIIDAAAKKMAMEAFQSTCSAVSKITMYPEESAGTDMICGGRIELLCEYIPSNDQAIEDFQSFGTENETYRKQILCTEFDENEECLKTVRRFLLKDGKINRVSPEANDIQNKLLNISRIVSGAALIALDGRKYCIDVIESRELLFIFGAGHVAKEVAALAMNVGFHAVILDDRDEFANAERFPQPAEAVVLDSFEGCFRNLAVDENSYVVIVTRGHVHDKTVLAQALKTRAGYIGMIGSRKKRDTIYKALLGEGFTAEDLERVHCPIGLPMDTDTPEEIAVSIVGQLIDVRAKKRKWSRQRSRQSS
jgi:xanthine dehydrogenase accessory factor